jgi:hypothetical protein
MIKELNDNPGPGNYLSQNLVGLHAPKFGFGSSQRMALKYDSSPGPGSYKIPV